MLGPNISGEVNVPNGAYRSGSDYFNAIKSFVFKSPDRFPLNPEQRGSGGGGGGRIVLNAQNSNAIYSQSNTVQPPSLLYFNDYKSIG